MQAIWKPVAWIYPGLNGQKLQPGLRMWYTSFMGGRWLFVDRLFVGGLFVHWVVICGGGGAMSCVVCSWLANLDGTSGGRVLTVIHNLNND